jgi:uncharacterized membrane protein YgcG
MQKIPSSLALLTLAALLSWSAPSAAYICDGPLGDEAQVLTAPTTLLPAVQALEAQGADVRVRTVVGSTNLDLTEGLYETACPSWQGAPGRRKSTLLVLLVSPDTRKMGLYYGEAWQRALGDHWNRIKQETMGPRFRDGDYTGGFAAALHTLQSRLSAAQEEVLHPVSPTTITTTINEGVKMDWLVTIVWILMGTGLLVGLLYAAGVLASTERRTRRQARRAQQRAVLAKSDAAAALNRLTPAMLTAHQQSRHQDLMVQFADLSQTAASDPSRPGLTTEEYSVIAQRYERMTHELEMWQQRTQAPRRSAERVSPSSTNIVVVNTPMPHTESSSASTSWWSSGSSGSSSSDSGSSSWGGGSSSYDSGGSGGGGSSSYDSGSSGGGGSSSSDSGSSGGGGSSDF